MWKAHEVDMLQQGVSKYGRNWKAILEDPEFAPTLGGRSPGSLKLKWYKMTKEHEEKINSATAWIQPGHHMPIVCFDESHDWEPRDFCLYVCVCLAFFYREHLMDDLGSMRLLLPSLVRTVLMISGDQKNFMLCVRALHAMASTLKQSSMILH